MMLVARRTITESPRTTTVRWSRVEKTTKQNNIRRRKHRINERGRLQEFIVRGPNPQTYATTTTVASAKGLYRSSDAAVRTHTPIRWVTITSKVVRPSGFHVSCGRRARSVRSRRRRWRPCRRVRSRTNGVRPFTTVSPAAAATLVFKMAVYGLPELALLRQHHRSLPRVPQNVRPLATRYGPLGGPPPLPGFGVIGYSSGGPPPLFPGIIPPWRARYISAIGFRSHISLFHYFFYRFSDPFRSTTLPLCDDKTVSYTRFKILTRLSCPIRHTMMGRRRQLIIL